MLLPLKLIPHPNTARRGYVLSSFFLQVFLLSVCKMEAFHIFAITGARVGTVAKDRKRLVFILYSSSNIVQDAVFNILCTGDPYYVLYTVLLIS